MDQPRAFKELLARMVFYSKAAYRALPEMPEGFRIRGQGRQSDADELILHFHHEPFTVWALPVYYWNRAVFWEVESAAAIEMRV
jgi:hypothetical protein